MAVKQKQRPVTTPVCNCPAIQYKTKFSTARVGVVLQGLWTSQPASLLEPSNSTLKASTRFFSCSKVPPTPQPSPILQTPLPLSLRIALLSLICLTCTHHAEPARTCGLIRRHVSERNSGIFQLHRARHSQMFLIATSHVSPATHHRDHTEPGTCEDCGPIRSGYMFRKGANASSWTYQNVPHPSCSSSRYPDLTPGMSYLHLRSPY